MGYIKTGNGELHYMKWGQGKKLLLAFHGYDNSAAIFGLFRHHLQHEYTTIAVDLPHHGHSQWPQNVPLTHNDLAEMVKQLREEYGVSAISLMGYSLGARVCLSIIQHMPTLVDKVVLLAADGLAINKYYYFFTRTLPGRKLFKSLLEKPEPYFRLAAWLQRKNLISIWRYKFAMRAMQSATHRQMLLQVWTGLSSLLPWPSRVRQAIRVNRIPVTIFMGAHDTVMPPALAGDFKKGLDTVQVVVLERGHRLFDHENAGQIAAHL